MQIAEKLRNIRNSGDVTKIITVCGCIGLALIMLSSFLPDKKTESPPAKKTVSVSDTSWFCDETEKRLEEFLSKIEGAGEVQVCITVGTGERCVYASEDRRSKSENRTEEERKYVIIGNGNEKNALVETVEPPEIIGVAVACSGCGSPVVQERIYKAVSAVLGMDTGRIYVTKLGTSTH